MEVEDQEMEEEMEEEELVEKELERKLEEKKEFNNSIQSFKVGYLYEMIKMNQKKKKLLCEFQDNTCEGCKKIFKLEELEVHRINRAWQGGTYKDHRNLKVLCVKCHKALTYGKRTGW